MPSTHWDREWYLPQRRYQFRLARLLEKVERCAADAAYANFLLDGQTIPLEDYLEINPGKRAALQALIARGKLTVGPWYVVPDTALISGEALVRNLEIGLRMREDFQGAQSVGYCPDMFGLASQLPQIFAQFGYQYIQYTRAQRTLDGQYHTEVLWKAPDGSALPALFAPYASGLFLSYQEIWKNMQRHRPDDDVSLQVLRAHMADTAYASTHRLLIVGIDHAEPREGLPETIAYLNANLTGARCVHSTQAAYFEAMAEELGDSLPLCEGEQRDRYDAHFCISNVLSSRMDLKLRNRELENGLQLYGDPLWAFCPNAGGFEDFELSGFLEHAWKLTVQSHFHDSICSCSTDAVLEDVEARMRNARYIVRDIVRNRMLRLAAGAPRGGDFPVALCVYNPLPFERDGWIDEIIRVPYDLPEVFRLVDAEGKPVPALCSVERRKRIDIETEKMDDAQVMADTTRYPLSAPEPEDMYTFVRVRLRAEELPACGYATYYFAAGEAAEAPDDGRGGAPRNVLENAALRVEIHENGSVSITDKATGRTLSRALVFEDSGDEGDAYTYSPRGDAHCFTEETPEIERLEENALRSVYRVRYALHLPGGALDAALVLELRAGDPVLYCRAELDNRAKDHRLRIAIPHAARALAGYADSPFDLVERPAMKAPLRREQMGTQPLRDLLCVPYADGAQLHIYSAGSYEYELINTGDTSCAYLTLLRCIGAVYKTTTLTRDESACGAGVRWWSERDQMQGRIAVSFALRFGAAEGTRSDWLKQAQAYQYPVCAAAALAEGGQAARASSLRVQGDCVLSTVRRDGETLTVRLYNPETRESLVTLRFAADVREAVAVDLAGRALCDAAGDGACALEIQGDTLTLPIAARRIATLRVKL